MPRRTLAAVLVLVLTAALAAATTASARSNDTRLGLVGYAVPREALGAIIKAWNETPEGKDVSFSQSYGASGDQARAVVNGLKTDIVQLSTGLDVDVIVKAGLIDPNWSKQSYKGIVSNSVVVFAVRPGNPKKIRKWEDLIKPGVEIITPNPFTSGAAKWNILAAYGSQKKQGKTEKQSVDFVRKLFKNVVVQARSGRDATNAFLSGKGDVLLAYENEALLSRRNGVDIQYYIPKQTMLIETPIAVLKNSENKEKANQFIRFTKSVTAQRIWAEYGFRPVNKQVAKEYRSKYPTRYVIYRIDDPIFGGWAKADAKWFNPRGSIMVAIEREIGGPTS
ncbi:MAG: sulfate ABC transporter substrate-binding protein [Gaiella sp.]